MGRLFLDVNIIIDIIEKRSDLTMDNLSGYFVYLSPLSLHILLYLYKKKIPYSVLNDFASKINLIEFDNAITNSSLIGPTEDFDDNVQLHSASRGECDYFLTRDKKLLDMKFFGKMRIVEKI